MLGNAEEIPVAIFDQRALRVGAVGAVKGCQGGNRAAAFLHLEHRAVVERAALISGSEEIALAVLRQAATGGIPRGPAKGGQRRDRVASIRDLVHHAFRAIERNTRAEQITAAIFDDAGLVDISSTVRGNGREGIRGWNELEHRSIPLEAATSRNPEHITVSIFEESILRTYSCRVREAVNSANGAATVGYFENGTVTI
jgi:hypothetical protein